jgi:hypothetical protein
MSRYVRLPSDQSDPLPHQLLPPSPSSPSASHSPASNRRPPPPAYAFHLFASLLPPESNVGGTDDDDDDCRRRDSSDITNTNNNNAAAAATASAIGMLASLKETASAAADGLRDNMSKASGSVRAGLGMPVPPGDDDADNNDNADAESQSSRMLEEVSEYCPTLTYQQVRGGGKGGGSLKMVDGVHRVSFFIYFCVR